MGVMMSEIDNDDPTTKTKLKIIIIAILSVVSGAILIIISTYQDNLISILKEEIVKEIGIALIIIGLAILFYEQFLRMEIINIVKNILKDILNEFFRKIENILNEIFEKKCEYKSIKLLGLKNLYRTSADNEIIDKGTKEIKLLGITTNYYFHDGSSHYRILQQLVTKGCKLKILMLNPKSIYANYRGEVENNPDLKGDIEKSFEKKIKFISELPAGSKSNVEIRYYNTYPLYSMTIIDDCLIRVTPFLYNEVGQKCPTSDYERKPGGIFDAYLKHFNDLWDEKKPLFDWNEIPGKDNDKLEEFLLKNYCISCGGIKINKSDEGKIITVSCVSNKLDILSFKLNIDRTKATLSIYYGRTDEFIVEKENDKLNIYKGTFDALAYDSKKKIV